MLRDDDLGIAIGSDLHTEQWDVSFNSSEITQIVRTQTEEDEAFFDWAFGTYPNICDSPAQCALALLDIADEYTQLP